MRQLKDLTGHSQIILKSRGNNAIRDALAYVKSSSRKTRILIQDQGGWLRYLDYPPKYGLEITKLKTDAGVIDLDDLEEKSKDTAAILYENPAGYIAEQPIEQIFEICNKNGCLVILDITGCIGDTSKLWGDHADILLASFGKDKPVNLGAGGFISCNERISLDAEEDFDDELLKKLEERLHNLPKRMQGLQALAMKVKKDLESFDIIHPDKKGINVAVRFSDEKEKQEIIDYCNKNDLEYTICPRYIRVMEDAVSIEIKRKDQ